MDVARVRHKGLHDFASYYEHLCAVEGSCPVASALSGAREGVLSCRLLRLSASDWRPLLAALRVNRDLHTAVFHDRWEERCYSAVKRAVGGSSVCVPTSFSGSKSARQHKSALSETTSSIASSVQQCLSVSKALTSLTLEGLPLTCRDCRCLAQGILKNSSLSHLSLKGSSIGDQCAEVICASLNNSCSLVWLDLTACNLTAHAASIIASMIKHQCLSHQSRSWKDTLRSCPAHTAHSRSAGLQRVSLNVNPGIGDEGAVELAEVLRDDVFLKALDVQTCGISNRGTTTFNEVLSLNTSLIVLDLRANPLIGGDLMEEVCRQLARNVAAMGSPEESYMWLEVQTDKMAKARRHSQPRSSRAQQMTTSRAGGAKSAPPTERPSRHGESKEVVTSPGKAPSYPRGGLHLHINGSSHPVASHAHASECAESHAVSVEEFRQLKLDVISYQDKLHAEIEKRKQLEVEKEQLRKELEELKSNRAVELPTHSPLLDVSSCDDEVLAAVEAAFKQFHAFMDLLNSHNVTPTGINNGLAFPSFGEQDREEV